MENVLQDLKYAFRNLRRSPGFVATIAITFALGVGANSAIFSLADREEIGGVEIYNSSASIPPQFKVWEDQDPRRRCGAIVFWTREKLGLPKAPKTGSP
jgi:hypothetical protein